MKTIYLDYDRMVGLPHASFTVTKTINTIRFDIGEEVSRDTVKGLCDGAAYKVIITERK